MSIVRFINSLCLLKPKADNFSRVTWVLSIFRKEDKVMEYEKAIWLTNNYRILTIIKIVKNFY